MEINQFLHAMPEAAQAEIAKYGVTSSPLEAGVDKMMISGHHKGVGLRFESRDEYNPVKSEELGIEVYDPYEVCFRYIDRKNIIPMRIPQDCPPNLLKFDKKTNECIGGLWKDAYLAWKTGRKAPGTQLRAWGVMPSYEIASLEADGIWTVEQYAEIPADRIASRYPQSFVDAHKRACQYVAGKEVRARAEATAGEFERVKAENAAMAERLAKLEALLEEKTEPKKVVNKLLEGRK